MSTHHKTSNVERNPPMGPPDEKKGGCVAIDMGWEIGSHFKTQINSRKMWGVMKQRQRHILQSDGGMTLSINGYLYWQSPRLLKVRQCWPPKMSALLTVLRQANSRFPPVSGQNWTHYRNFQVAEVLHYRGNAWSSFDWFWISSLDSVKTTC